MSAVTVEHDVNAPAHTPSGASLTVVERPRSTVSALGFGLIIMALVVAGLAVVMVVTTSVAQQSRELSRLTTESTELGYHAAALTTELQELSSASSLALRASRLGMVPNTYPVFISLEDGSVHGEPTPVKGDELPFLQIEIPESSLSAAEPPGDAGADG
ncbi:MAG: hypothetical protein R2722_07835 [Tessaracoccus sp.]